MKNPPDYAIPQLGDAQHNILDSQIEWQQAGILDLDAVIEQRDSDGRSMLCVVRMDDGIQERLPDRYQRNWPTILPAKALDDRFAR